MTYTVAVIVLHPDCGMSCRFCITDDGVDVMTWEQATQLVDLLVAGGRCRVVTLGGGEPLLWPHGPAELAEYAKSQGLMTQLATAGGDELDGIIGAGVFDRVILPLESAAPASHDDLRRGMASHHGRVMGWLALARERGQAVTVSTVVTSVNESEVPALAAWLHDYDAGTEHVHAWHLYRFAPEGRGGSRATDLAVSDATYAAAMDAARGAGLRFPVYRRDPHPTSTRVHFYWSRGGVVCRDDRPFDLRI
jgi:MoaA/NifB/PqqE/SkfB family radical SAM enzyme